MTTATIPRRMGDDYQARVFWLEACRMFEDTSKVARVGFEVDSPKSFDDVAVQYVPGMLDERRAPLHADHYQVKFHMDHAGAVTWKELLEPSFIGASSTSFLERLRDAHTVMRDRGLSARFILALPWPIHPDDSLASLVSDNNGELRCELLFDGKGPRSAMGKIRTAYCQKLGVSEADLESILRCVRIHPNAGLMDVLGDRLRDKLALAGFVPWEDGTLTTKYDDLIHKLHAAGRREFDRTELQQAAEQEGLWRGRQQPDADARRLGIRSFTRWAEYLEDETDELLCLVRHFDGRHIRQPLLWQASVAPELATFISQAARGSGPLQLHLDTHSAVAFAAGHLLDSKSGAAVTVMQRGRSGKIAWGPLPHPADAARDLWSMEEVFRRAGAKELAVSISTTHGIAPDVRGFVERSLPSVGRVLDFTIQPAPGPSAVRDGGNAVAAAEQLLQRLRTARSLEERSGVLHVFSAAPNGLMFRIGQLSRCLGPCQLYEYDFDTCAAGAYAPAVRCPI